MLRVDEGVWLSLKSILRGHGGTQPELMLKTHRASPNFKVESSLRNTNSAQCFPHFHPQLQSEPTKRHAFERETVWPRQNAEPWCPHWCEKALTYFEQECAGIGLLPLEQWFARTCTYACFMAWTPRAPTLTAESRWKTWQSWDAGKCVSNIKHRTYHTESVTNVAKTCMQSPRLTLATPFLSTITSNAIGHNEDREQAYMEHGNEITIDVAHCVDIITMLHIVLILSLK